MKRTGVALLVIVLFLSCLIPISVQAENLEKGFDWEEYSLEELLAIRDELSEVIESKQREYAIEHGDRVITLPEEEVVYVGGKLSVEATIERVVDDAPEKTELVWISSDESIVTVSNQGVVSGVSAGEAIITCKASDNEYVFAEMPIKCVLPVVSVTLNETKATALLFEGKDSGLQLECTITPEDAYCKDIEWGSSSESIATVDEQGYVRFLSAGNVTITAKSKDPFSAAKPKEARCVITVVQAVSEITLDQTSIVMNKSSAVTLKASVLPANAGNKKVIWESSDSSIVSVNNGQLKALACGSAEITCAAADGSGAKVVCKVEVIQMVTSIKLNDVKASLTLDRGESLQLSADVLPADATKKDLVWESSDDNIVSVSENGKISAKNGGTATITCSAADGSGKSASVSVCVPSISVEADGFAVVSKDGLSFDVNFYGKSGDFEITPMKTAFFTLSQTQFGNKITVKITPLKAGKANITLKDKSDNKSTRQLVIVIDHSAVYDASSYPVLNHSDLLRNPDQFDGRNCSVYGKILQITESGGFLNPKRIHLRLGTAGYGFYDKVYWVTIDPSVLDTNLIEDDMITVYGVCSGNYTYTALFGNSITIPSITAEKVIMGKS